MRALPGMLSPRYHELHVGAVYIVPVGDPVHLLDPGVLRLERGRDLGVAVVAHVLEQLADPLDVLLARMTMFARTDGLPGPVMVKKFGNPTVCTPR